MRLSIAAERSEETSPRLSLPTVGDCAYFAARETRAREQVDEYPRFTRIILGRFANCRTASALTKVTHDENNLVAQIGRAKMSISLSAAQREGFTPADRFARIAVSANRDPQALVTLNDYMRTLHGYSSRLHFRRGETIFGEGDPADRVYKVIAGTLRLCRYSPDGRRHVTDFVLAGDLMGFLECISQPATAEAVTDVTLVSYPRTCVDRLAASNPEIGTRVRSHLSANLLVAQHQLFVLGCQNAKERVASFLVRLAERADLMPGEDLDLPMGRQDIADHLGLSVETICRTLSALKSEGVVSVPNSHELSLRDMPALRALASDN